MGVPMTTSGMTNPQIDRACELLRAELTMHRDELPADAVQQAFGDSSLPKEWFESLRTRAEAVSDLIVRHVRKVPGRTNAQVIAATGRRQYINEYALATMPRGGNEEEDIGFFSIKRTSSPAEVQAAYDRYNLEPDPEGVAKVNEDDPAFADQHPNVCLWQDAQGRWTCVAFIRWDDGGRNVHVGRDGDHWDDYWWFGGRRKNALEPSGTGN